MNHRSFSRFLLICLLTTLSALKAQAEPFRFVVLPDTQIYSWALHREDFPNPSDAATVTNPDGTFPYFLDQTEWIADNAEDLGIKHVIHLGDIVQHATDLSQWERAKTAMGVLDDHDISYGIAVGGHDVDGSDFTNYLHYFGPDHFAGKENYFSSPSGYSNYQIIPHEGVEFIFVNVAIDTPEAEVQWAMEVLSQHHDKIAIISTHKYLWDYRFGWGRNGETVQSGLLFGQVLNDTDDPTQSQQSFYERFVGAHPNILMVMAGHVHGDLQRMDGRNGANLPVLEILSDYQDGRNGGDGYLRIYEFDLQSNTLRGRTYSPSLDRDRTFFEGFVESIKVINDIADSHHLDFLPDFVIDIGLKLLRRSAVDDVNIVENHPQYQAEPEYYDQLLIDLHGGETPDHIGSLTEWEVFWLFTYANDRQNPNDYTPNLRNPNVEVEVNFDDYLKGETVEKPKETWQQKIERYRFGISQFFEDLLLLLGLLY